MPDVGGLIRIDRRVLHDRLGRVGSDGAFLSSGPRPCRHKKCTALQVGVQIAAAGNFKSRDAVDRANRSDKFLRNHTRRFFQALRQFEADRRCYLAHLEARRPLR